MIPIRIKFRDNTGETSRSDNGESHSKSKNRCLGDNIMKLTTEMNYNKLNTKIIMKIHVTSIIKLYLR